MGRPVALTLNDLTVNFSHLPRETLLQEWVWLIGTRRFPILITALGDAFVQDADDGSVHLLSAGAGTLSRVSEDVAAFRQRLADRTFVLDNFVPSIIETLRDSGKSLGHGQLYSYRVPPALGGEYSADNLEPTDISVHFSILGQINQRARNLPEGTGISGVQFSDD
jgi:hypothetical protein